MSHTNQTKTFPRSNDRRYIPRWETESRILYQFENSKEFLHGKTVDLNSTGTCLCVGTLPSPERKVNLTIYLTDHTVIECEGNIVWTKQQNDKTFLGVRFTNPDAETQEVILEHAFKIDRDRFLEQFFRGWKNHKA